MADSHSPNREASPPGFSNDVGGTYGLPESILSRLERMQREKVSSSRNDEKNDQISRDTGSDDCTPILSFLSTLNQEVTHTVDDDEMKVGTSGHDESEPSSSSFGGFFIPGSFHEAATGCEFSDGLAFTTRHKELGDSDLSLSLGIGRAKRSGTFCNESSYATSNRTANSPSESTHTQLGLQTYSRHFPSDGDREASNKRLKSTETPAAQLTIFYGGSVHIYNDVSQDKARAIMLLAERANAFPANVNQSRESPVGTQSHSSNPCQNMPHQSSPSSALDTAPHGADAAGRSSSSVVSKSMSGLKPAVKVSYTALPQARRISLQRFLQKRTERSREISPLAPSKNIDKGATPPRSVPSSPSASGSRPPSPAS